MNNNTFGNNRMFGRNWTVELPANEITEGMKILFGNLNYNISGSNNIFLLNSDGIEQIGFTTSNDCITITKDINLTKRQILEGNYVFRTPLVSAVCISTSPDVVVINLDQESMEKLMNKNLLPLDPYTDNIYIRIPNQRLDVYKFHFGQFVLLSDEASKEIIQIYNKQCDRMELEKADD